MGPKSLGTMSFGSCSDQYGVGAGVLVSYVEDLVRSPPRRLCVLLAQCDQLLC